ncbi:MAG: LPS export ABC transporter permease LptF [Alphaproteobacteria bacterium]|nr:LPS export ABC transporter permease LptF [Alphaproteobacteria bacterium]
MTRLDTYMFRQLAIALVAVAVGLVALVWVTQSLRFIELVLERGLSLLVFLELTGLLLPSFLAIILPVTTFVVVLFTYVRLGADREITVMRAAGLSPWQIARPALAVAGLASVIGYLLTLWLVPLTQSAFRDWQFEIRNEMAGLLFQEGVFSTLGGDLTVYARARERDGTLRGILVHDARDRGTPVTLLAEAGRLTTGPSGPRVTLINGQRQQVERVGGEWRLTILAFAENSVELGRATRADQARARTVQERSLAELLDPPPDTPPRDSMRFLAEAQQRLASPLQAISLALVALAVALVGPFRRHGGGLKLALGAAIAVGIVALGLVIVSAAGRHAGLLPLIWLYTVLPGVVAAWVLQGAPGWPRTRPA